jgi:hypothetical protein
MSKTYFDQFYTMDPGNPPKPGTILKPQTVKFEDHNDDGFIGTGAGDTFDGVKITQVWENDTITVKTAEGEIVTIKGVTFYLSKGPAVFTPVDGSTLDNVTFVSSTYVSVSTKTAVGKFAPACFTPGTMIETPGGARLIETLVAGDLVSTLDRGPQSLIWIGRQRVRAYGLFAPVQFQIGAIGNTVPITVSQQHRMLISGWRAELYFGQDAVFVAAKHLVDGRLVRIVPGGVVDYLHLLFRQHEVVISNGVPSESYFPAHALTQEDAAARREVNLLFPDMPMATCHHWQTARSVLRRTEAVLIAA